MPREISRSLFFLLAIIESIILPMILTIIVYIIIHFIMGIYIIIWIYSSILILVLFLYKYLDRIPKTILKIIKHNYFKFVLKKVAFYVVVLFIAVTLAFFIPRLLPGDPLRQLITPPPGSSDEAIKEFLRKKAELIKYLGLDKPLLEQYFDFWIHLLKFDLGPSYSWQMEPVISVVKRYLPYTLVLVIPGILITFFIGNWIGGRIGFHKSKKNTFLYYFFIVLQSAPFFWISLLIIDIFIIKLRLVPYTPAPDFSLDPRILINLLNHFWLPFFTLIFCFSGGWATGMRSMTIYELDSDYMLYCEKLGFRKRKLRRYAERNALLPQFTGLNLRLSELIGATLIIEMVFLWPGIGRLTYEAFISLDYPLIIGTFIITILVIVIGNFIIDITYGFIDPRIKAGHED